MKCYVFAYGTLCDAKVRKEVIGYTTKAVPASIRGFRKSKIVLDHVCYPILEIDPSSKSPLEGSIFAINCHDLPRLDAYESKAYQRIRVDTDRGEKAWVYIKNEE